MHTWPVQDAKARFSEFLDACLHEGPQKVTRRGAQAAAAGVLPEINMAVAGSIKIIDPAQGDCCDRRACADGVRHSE